ncbi:class I SAM-dependent methyltransferase [Shimia aestuarii]|nr:class I SAM-dependent methyltransferase [Shimia aestuarii]
MSDKDAKSVMAQNLEAWEQVAPIHARHNQDNLLKAFSDPGFTLLDDVAIGVLKALEVADKDVAQVCCNNGRELICIERLGAANCVGFDGAEGFVEQGRELANAAGSQARFVCCEAHAFPPEYHGTFDIVLITIGVLSWMPDIDRFMASVTRLLRPGGALFIYEHHPILFMFEPGPPKGPIVWELSYFDKSPYLEKDGLDYYGGESYDAKPATSFSHTMAEIIMSGVKSGLRVEDFTEYPTHISNTWYNLESAELGLPMSYTLVFRAPDPAPPLVSRPRGPYLDANANIPLWRHTCSKV